MAVTTFQAVKCVNCGTIYPEDSHNYILLSAAVEHPHPSHPSQSVSATTGTYDDHTVVVCISTDCIIKTIFKNARHNWTNRDY